MKKLTLVCLLAMLSATSWSVQARINLDYNLPPLDINPPAHSTSSVLKPTSEFKVAGVYWLPDYLDKNLDFSERSQDGGEKPTTSKDCTKLGYSIPSFVSDWSKYNYKEFLAANKVRCYKNFTCKPNFSKSTCPQWYQFGGGSCRDARGTFYERCDPKPCASGYTAGVTSCSPASGYNYSSNGYSGTQICGRCDVKPCASGYTAGRTSCSPASGYNYSSNAFSGTQICGRCDAKPCPSGYSTTVTSCTTGYNFAINGMSGSANCGICNQRPCSDNGLHEANPNSGVYKCSAQTWGGKTCYSCYQPQCSEGGYGTNSSQAGYICSATNYYGRTCYKCVADPCAQVSAVGVPSNAYCSASYSTCSSKCSSWACNSGYTKSGSSCICATSCSNTVTSKPANSYYITSSCTACGVSATIQTGWKCNSGYTNWCSVPNTDCNALGYSKTPTQCSNGYLKCPFDTTKVFCKN